MTRPILVAYATRRESSHEVADAVAAGLRELGHEADVRPAAEVGTLAPYGAVVIGGALYMGRWHRDARRFLTGHREALAGLAVAVFAMGPRTLDTEDVAGSRRQLDAALADVPEVEPVAVTIFGGVLDPTKLHFPLNRLTASDARDWNAIATWADDVASAFEAFPAL